MVVLIYLLCGEMVLVLRLVVVEPVGRANVLRLLCFFFEPAGYRICKLGLVAHALGEGDVRRPEAVPVEQFTQRPQTLQLARTVDPVARPGAGRLDQAHALEITQHSSRPSGRLRCLVDRKPVQRGGTLPQLCQGWPTACA